MEKLNISSRIQRLIDENLNQAELDYSINKIWMAIAVLIEEIEFLDEKFNQLQNQHLGLVQSFSEHKIEIKPLRK